MKREIETQPSLSKQLRLPKRKVALYLGYNGTGYYGMQINDSLPTIEADLFKALCKAGCVSEANSDSIQKIGFMRACRTDKGVHAAAQVTSFKMQLPNEHEHDAIVRSIQTHLPSSIHIYGFTKVTGGFHAKNACTSRIYEYLIPTYAFKQWDDRFLQEEFFSSKQKPIKTDLSDDNLLEGSKDWKQKGLEDRESIYSYRISSQEQESISNLLGLFQGTHNFHNFTAGKLPSEPSSQRFIRSFTCGTPFLNTKDNLSIEWMSLRVHGQSFMLHQIRKMIGFVVLLMKTKNQSQQTNLFDLAFSPSSKLNIPKVPSLGLLLERCFFDSYNTNPNCQHTDQVSFQQFNEQIEQFKETQIYPQMFQKEWEEMEFWNWIGCIQEHSYEFAYLNSNSFNS